MMISIIQKRLFINISIMFSAFFCISLYISNQAYAFDDSLMGKTEDQVLPIFGKPDGVFNFSPTVTRYVYGETREGAADWAYYYITESYMITFKDGKLVAITASFGGYIDNDGIPKQFPRLKKYKSSKLKNFKTEKTFSGDWVGIKWKGPKYNYWARCFSKEEAYNRSTKSFKLTDIEHIEDYYLVQYQIIEKNYEKEIN